MVSTPGGNRGVSPELRGKILTKHDRLVTPNLLAQHVDQTAVQVDVTFVNLDPVKVGVQNGDVLLIGDRALRELESL